LEQRVNELTALYELGSTAVSTLDLDELLENCLRITARHLNFDRALILLLDEERQALTYGQSVGFTPAQVEALSATEIPLGESERPIVQVFRGSEPLLVSDQPGLGLNIAELAPSGAAEPFVGAPLVSKGRRLGVLVLDNAE